MKVRPLGIVLACVTSVACAREGGVRATPTPAVTLASAGPVRSSPAVPVTIDAKAAGTHPVVATKQIGTRKVYVLRADAERGHYFGSDTGESTFVRPFITFYPRSGKILEARAPLATLRQHDRRAVMSGGVVARTADGITLHCETLRYDDASDHIYGDGSVLLTSPHGESLAGDTIDWNLSDGSIDVGRHR